MHSSELYKLWAPENSPWSNWAKPVLFADRSVVSGILTRNHAWKVSKPAWATSFDKSTAIVLDLPGADAVWLGVALARQGFRPVPLYNGVPGPSALVNVEPIFQALQQTAVDLTAATLPPESPPVFLLDSNRFNGASLAKPGRFDNRWWVFPQDFPSSNFLLSHGIRSVALGQTQSTRPQQDLAHVLLRWQEAGIAILACDVNDSSQPSPIQVQKPNRFRSLWYRALVLAGLRRNSAGGFGAVIPQPSSGSGYG